MELLNRKGFVFLDAKGTPFRCMLLDNNPWLLYWNCNNQWTTLRKVLQSEVRFFRKYELPKEQQEYYFK